MSARIPQHFIDELLSRTDIVDIIEDFVPLRKAGKNYQALCPFHDEKTPSFTVNRDKQFYHCFGCGVSGTAITFLMNYNRMDFLEVIEDLAGKAGLEIPREGGYTRKDTGLREQYELMELAVEFYRDQLRTHPDARQAVDYLKNRGITGELAARFELGYAPAGWDNLLRKLGQSTPAQIRLEKAGLAIKQDGGGYHDRFRNRIMFPIRDHRGRAIGFGGRVLGEEHPKYLNSPETPIFHKGNELYGLFQAMQEINERQNVFVVEGYMDVLALAQHNIANVVATLGTAATTEQFNRIFRYAGQIIFCFDGDEAGQKAAWRAMETILPLLRDGRQAYFMFIPDGMDPDDYVRKDGPEVFQDEKNRVPLSRYLLDTMVKDQHGLSTMEARSRLLERTLPLLSRLPQGAFRQILLQELSSLAKTPLDEVSSLLEKSKKIPANHNLVKNIRGHGRTAVTGIIELILHRPDLAGLIEDPQEFEHFPVPGAAFLKDLVELVHARPQITCAGIIENWRDTKYAARLSQIAAESDARTRELTAPERELLDAMNALREKRDKHLRQKLSNIKRMSDLSEEEKERLRMPRAPRQVPPDQ